MRNTCILKPSRGRGFPGGLVVKTSPSNAGVAASMPGQGAESDPICLKTPKNQTVNQKQYIVINSIKTLKVVHIKKS